MKKSSLLSVLLLSGISVFLQKLTPKLKTDSLFKTQKRPAIMPGKTSFLSPTSMGQRRKGEICQVSKDGKSKLIVDAKADKINSAGTAYIKKDNLLVVPTFYKNSVIAYIIE